MADHRNLVGVIYDTHSLAIRRIVIDAPNLNAHVRPGESLATAPRAQGHSLDRAYEIVRLKTGRHPPAMRDVHAADALARGMNGGRLLVR